MEHHDETSPDEQPTSDGGRHRRGGGAGRRARGGLSFRTAVTLAGTAAVVLTVAAGAYVASRGTPPATRSEDVVRTNLAPLGERSVAAAPGTTYSGGGKVARYVDEVVALANAEREKAGCAPLRSERRLAESAQAHADDMADRDYYEHTTPEGRDAGDRITAAGYTWSSWAENIHRGPKTPVQAMEDWMSSDGHRRHILNCAFKDIGVGVALAADGPWWVQNFGTRR
ncbi:CAP domain-containing protein [Streptomyces sp. NPDC026092]|uniref:CAP domain-containing protein n=1 Tax=Streptomyces sp. NPDC026092 TaxID=3154797 RepID=UPI0033BFBCB3